MATSNRRQKEKGRPPSNDDNKVDIHVFVIPSSLWRPDLRFAYNTICVDSISCGFVRALPSVTLKSLRDEITHQLDCSLLPSSFVFLRSIGKCLTSITQKQESSLKLRLFLPPLAPCPEIYVLDSDCLQLPIPTVHAPQPMHGLVHRPHLPYDVHYSSNGLAPGHGHGYPIGYYHSPHHYNFSHPSHPHSCTPPILAPLTSGPISTSENNYNTANNCDQMNPNQYTGRHHSVALDGPGQLYAPAANCYSHGQQLINSSTANRSSCIPEEASQLHCDSLHSATQQQGYQYLQKENGIASNDRECNDGTKRPLIKKQLAFDQTSDRVKSNYTRDWPKNNCGQLNSSEHGANFAHQFESENHSQQRQARAANDSSNIEIDHTSPGANYHGGANRCKEPNEERMETQHYHNKSLAKPPHHSQNASLSHQPQLGDDSTTLRTNKFRDAHGNRDSTDNHQSNSNHGVHQEDCYYSSAHGDCDDRPPGADKDIKLERTLPSENFNASNNVMKQPVVVNTNNPNDRNDTLKQTIGPRPGVNFDCSDREQKVKVTHATGTDLEPPSQFNHEAQGVHYSDGDTYNAHYVDIQNNKSSDCREITGSNPRHTRKPESKSGVDEHDSFRVEPEARNSIHDSNRERECTGAAKGVEEQTKTVSDRQHKERQPGTTAARHAQVTTKPSVRQRTDKGSHKGATGRKRSATFPPPPHGREKNSMSDKQKFNRQRQAGKDKRLRANSESHGTNIPVLAQDHKKNTKPRASQDTDESVTRSTSGKEDFSRRVPLPPIGGTVDNGQSVNKNSVMSKEMLVKKSKSEVRRPSTRETNVLLSQIRQAKEESEQLSTNKSELSAVLRNIQYDLRTQRERADKEWKRKFFQEKKFTSTLEDRIKKAKDDLQQLQAQLDKRQGNFFKDSLHTASVSCEAPSELSNMKIRCKKNQASIQTVRTELEAAKKRLSAERNARKSLENECKDLRRELLKKKIACTRTKRQPISTQS